MRFIVISVLIIFLLYLLIPRKTKSGNFKIKNTTYQLELAKTISQQATGLSGRTSLCSNCGMLFVFAYEDIWPFWMQNTLIPLDIIWLDKNGKIVHYVNATELKSLKILKNSTPAKYVLELNSGDFDKLKLKLGDEILHNYPQL